MKTYHVIASVITKILSVLALCVFEFIAKTYGDVRTYGAAHVKYCAMAGITTTQTLKFISSATNSQNVSRSLIFKWHKRFTDRRSVRPKLEEKSVSEVSALLTQNRRKLLKSLALNIPVPIRYLLKH